MKKIKYPRDWTSIPDWINRGNLLHKYEKILMNKILANSWGFQSCRYHKKVTFKELGRDLDLNERAVSKYMKDLRARNLIHFEDKELKMIEVNMEQMVLFDDMWKERCKKHTLRIADKTFKNANSYTPNVKKVHSPPLNKDNSKDITKEISKEQINFLDFEKKWLFKEKLNIEATKRAWYNESLSNQKLIIKTLEHSQKTYKKKADTEGSTEYLPQAHIYISEGRYKKFLEAVKRDDNAEKEYKKTIALRGLYNRS